MNSSYLLQKLILHIDPEFLLMTKTRLQSLESCNQKNILCRLLSKTNNTFMKYSGNKSSSQYLYPAKFKSILVKNETIFFSAWKQIVQNKKIHKSKQLHRKNNIASSSKASHIVMTNLNCIHIILLGLKLLSDLYSSSFCLALNCFHFILFF